MEPGPVSWTPTSQFSRCLFCLEGRKQNNNQTHLQVLVVTGFITFLLSSYCFSSMDFMNKINLETHTRYNSKQDNSMSKRSFFFFPTKDSF